MRKAISKLGDLTSSRPTVAATQCEMEHGKVVENVDERRGRGEGNGGGRERDEETASGCSGWRNR